MENTNQHLQDTLDQAVANLAQCIAAKDSAMAKLRAAQDSIAGLPQKITAITEDIQQTNIAIATALAAGEGAAELVHKRAALTAELDTMRAIAETAPNLDLLTKDVEEASRELRMECHTTVDSVRMAAAQTLIDQARAMVATVDQWANFCRKMSCFAGTVIPDDMKLYEIDGVTARDLVATGNVITGVGSTLLQACSRIQVGDMNRGRAAAQQWHDEHFGNGRGRKAKHTAIQPEQQPENLSAPETESYDPLQASEAESYDPLQAPEEGVV